MKAPAAVSPFTAKTSQEQKDQWIWWQCQQIAAVPVGERPIAGNAADVPELQLPTAKEEKQAEAPVQRQTTRHSQYDAVVRRMQHATQKAMTYTSVKG